MMPAESVDQHLAVYAVERHDDTSALVLAFTMVTAGFTYMVGAAFYLAGQCDQLGCGGKSWIALSLTTCYSLIGIRISSSDHGSHEAAVSGAPRS